MKKRRTKLKDRKFVFLVTFFLLCFLLGAIGSFVFFFPIKPEAKIYNGIIQEILPSPTPTPTPLPTSYIISKKLHVFQTFNNCGPATLSMALSYNGINKSQKELGNILRPYQIAGGDNDDKSVTLIEVANQAKEYGLTTYLRPNGTIEKLKQLIANDIPVITRTWLKANEDIGHYRIVRGYNDSAEEILQDDSLQGNNLSYSYKDFEKLWLPFNYEYLVLVPADKKDLVEKILGEELTEKKAWENALVRVEAERDRDPQNWNLTFALSRIYYYLRDYKASISEFEKVENTISFRTLWYQIEPVLALYEDGQYDRVLTLTNKVLSNQNLAYSELYIIRGDIYEKKNDPNAARIEYEKAIRYNTNSREAKSRLSL